MARTVLIVDDSDLMRQLLSEVFHDEGYDVISAVNGRDALAQLKGVEIDIVLTELNMHGMDGVQLIKHLRTIPCYSSVPIVIMTSGSEESRIKEAKAVGACCWLIKPFMPNQLIEAIKRYVPRIYHSAEADFIEGASIFV